MLRSYNLVVSLTELFKNIASKSTGPSSRERRPSRLHPFERYKGEVEERIERRGRLALSSKVKSEKNSEMYGGSSKGIGMKLYLHGPMDFAKTLKLRFRVGDLDLPERGIPVAGRRRK